MLFFCLYRFFSFLWLCISCVLRAQGYKARTPRYIFFAHFEFQHPGMHYTHLFIFFLVSHFFAFFKAILSWDWCAQSPLGAHTTRVVRSHLQAQFVRSRGRQIWGAKRSRPKVYICALSSATSVQGSSLVTVSLQLSDDLVHFFILKPFQRKCCQPPSEGDPATLNASSEGQQFHILVELCCNLKKRREEVLFIYNKRISSARYLYMYNGCILEA